MWEIGNVGCEECEDVGMWEVWECGGVRCGKSGDVGV